MGQEQDIQNNDAPHDQGELGCGRAGDRVDDGFSSWARITMSGGNMIFINLKCHR